MSNDIFWFIVIAINFSGFFLQIERPVWAYHLKKWSTVVWRSDTGFWLSFNLIDVAVTIVLFSFLWGGSSFLVRLFFPTLILFYTGISIIKLINALPFWTTKKRASVKILDSFAYFAGRRKYILIKADVPELGIRVLPVYQLDLGLELRPDSNIFITYRKGCLGIIYKFSFDYLF